MKKYLPISIIVSTFLLMFSAPANAATSGPTNPYSFSAQSGTQPGTIILKWYDDGSAINYNLFYGSSQTNYTFGVVDIPFVHKKTNSFTVGELTPGQTYYFKLTGMKKNSTISSGPIMTKAATKESINQNTSSLNYQLDHSGIPYAFSLHPGDKSGSVIITWVDNGSANKYDIVYGKNPSVYDYGVQNVPYTPNANNSYKIEALTPYTTYYFALVAEKNNNVVSWTQSLSIYTQ